MNRNFLAVRDKRPLDGVHRYVLERLDKLVQCRVGLVCQHEKGRFWNARLVQSPLFGDVSQHFFALEPSRRCDGCLLLDKEIAVRIKDTQLSEHDGEWLQRRVLDDRGAKRGRGTYYALGSLLRFLDVSTGTAVAMTVSAVSAHIM